MRAKARNTRRAKKAKISIFDALEKQRIVLEPIADHEKKLMFFQLPFFFYFLFHPLSELVIDLLHRNGIRGGNWPVVADVCLIPPVIEAANSGRVPTMIQYAVAPCRDSAFLGSVIRCRMRVVLVSWCKSDRSLKERPEAEARVRLHLPQKLIVRKETIIVA